MFTANQAKKNIEVFEENLRAERQALIEKECEDIGKVIESVSKRGYKDHHYYKPSNTVAIVQGVCETLKENGYEVEKTSTTSLKIKW